MAQTIAIFSAQYAPHLGGVERFTAGLGAALEACGVHAVVVSTAHEGAPEHETQPDGVEVFRLPAYQVLDGRLPLTIPGPRTDELLAQVAALEPSGVLVNTRFYEQSVVGCAFAYELGVHPVVLEHGSSYIGFGVPGVDTAVHAHEHLATRRVLAYRPVFYGVSEMARAWLSTFGIEGRGVIHNAVDAAAFRAGASERDFRAELGIPADALLVAFTGRLVYDKGADVVARAAQLVAERGCTAHFAIAGDGPEREQIEHEAGPNTPLLGRVSSQDVAALLQQADLFLFPSRYPEGMPTSILEAAACGLTSLATNVGGVREVMPTDEYGFVFDELPAEVCAEAVAFYDENRDVLAAQGALCRARVEQEFSWEKTAAAVVAACEDAQQV